MLAENLQRDQLTPLEEGRAFSRLVDLGLSQRILATRVGRSPFPIITAAASAVGEPSVTSESIRTRASSG